MQSLYNYAAVYGPGGLLAAHCVDPGQQLCEVQDEQSRQHTHDFTCRDVCAHLKCPPSLSLRPNSAGVDCHGILNACAAVRDIGQLLQGRLTTYMASVLLYSAYSLKSGC